MGEIADAMVNGEMCDQCGQFLQGPPPGYPRTCTDCGGGAPLASFYEDLWEGSDKRQHRPRAPHVMCGPFFPNGKCMVCGSTPAKGKPYYES